LDSPAIPDAYTLFAKDKGGWWLFKGLAVEKEGALKLLELHKHEPHVVAIVVLELPTGHIAYEWCSG
jgi:hypothetical protein